MIKVGEVNILGTVYTIYLDDTNTDSMLNSNYAYIDPIFKVIKFRSVDGYDFPTADGQRVCMNETLRHEIIHGFFFESGLSRYYADETLVEFLALQFPKIDVAFEMLDILDDSLRECYDDEEQEEEIKEKKMGFDLSSDENEKEDLISNIVDILKRKNNGGE